MPIREMVELVLTGYDCSHHSPKCISEMVIRASILQDLHFVCWIMCELDSVSYISSQDSNDMNTSKLM